MKTGQRTEDWGQRRENRTEIGGLWTKERGPKTNQKRHRKEEDQGHNKEDWNKWRQTGEKRAEDRKQKTEKWEQKKEDWRKIKNT